MIVHQDEGIGRVRDHGLKNFSWGDEGLVHAALANRADLNEVLLDVKENGPQAFAVEKTHLAAEIGDCKRTIDRERLTLLP